MGQKIHSLLMLLMPLAAGAQTPVAPLTWWMATVDSATQQIVLRWQPSADSSAMGYHICSGTPCLDYDTVYGWSESTHICLDHSPMERHTYRLHVFDSAMNVSALTPSFGNVLLTADVPECATTVHAEWTPYTGLPQGQPRYRLELMLEPLHEGFTEYYTTQDSSQLSYTFEMPEAVTRARMRVVAEGAEGIRSLSNVIEVERRTVDSASVVEIEGLEYDSVRTEIRLALQTDPAFDYTLYRSIDGTPWREVATFSGSTTRYTDSDINPYDSLHCYQLGVKDACGMNERYSTTRCLVVPDPPAPAAWLPNAIVAGDDRNGVFRPVVRGLLGDLYELEIYNRAGMLVYRTEEPAAGWTPTAESRGGVYTYRLRCRFNTGTVKTYTGTVLLIK